MARWREEERQEAHPYLRLRQTLAQGPEAPLPQADLAAITLEDLLQLQARLLRPERAVLVLHGDLGLEQAKRLVRLNLGTWTGGPRPESPAGPTPSAHPAPQDPGRIPTRSPGFRAQALAPGPPDLSPEAAALLGLLLTGAPPLLPLELSVEGRNLLATVDAWNGASGVATWSLLGERLEALRRRSFTQAELDQARSAWRSRRSLDSLYPEAQMEAALAQARGRALSPERMQALSPEALQAALRVWLAPARLRVGAAGPPEALKALPAP
jgi:predicted Zn-dependent peptidase